IIHQRPLSVGSAQMRPVEVDDIARALVSFARGCNGTIEASWVAHGRKMQIEFEVVGELGTLFFTQERFNELQLYRPGDEGSRNGFKTILAGPQHEPYGWFC